MKLQKVNICSLTILDLSCWAPVWEKNECKWRVWEIEGWRWIKQHTSDLSNSILHAYHNNNNEKITCYSKQRGLSTNLTHYTVSVHSAQHAAACKKTWVAAKQIQTHPRENATSDLYSVLFLSGEAFKEMRAGIKWEKERLCWGHTSQAHIFYIYIKA